MVISFYVFEFFFTSFIFQKLNFKLAVSRYEIIYQTNIYILTDSRLSLLAILSHKPSQFFCCIQEIHCLLEIIHKKVCLQWIQSHCNLLGNDVTDWLTRTISNMEPKPLLVEILNLFEKKKKKILRALDEAWKCFVNSRTRYEILKDLNRLILYNNISRSKQTLIARIRMSHIITEK